MYQGGSRPERDWWQDAQRQEEERRREEKARRAEEHLTVQRRKAADMTAAVDRQIRIPDGLLTDFTVRFAADLPSAENHRTAA